MAMYQMPKIMEPGMFMPYQTIRNNTWYELITSGFLHGGLTHLLFNMITLLFFGLVKEQTIGQEHFLILYFKGLLASSIPSLIKHKDNPVYVAIGAVWGIIYMFAFVPNTIDHILTMIGAY